MSLASMIPFLSALLAASAANVDPATLDTAAAEYRTIAREYRLDGIVEAINRTTVSAQTQGQVQEIYFDVDDFVEKDDVVARLKDTEHRSRVAQATAELQSATATLDQARDDFDRIKGLFEKQAVSRTLQRYRHPSPRGGGRDRQSRSAGDERHLAGAVAGHRRRAPERDPRGAQGGGRTHLPA
jgi:multidrug efflux pump subunit AcrA (membrane-fusion protein)